MASPQTEQGYTRIANELLEAVVRHDFSKREYKVILAVLRKTYGYNKKADDMSVSQVANSTNLDVSPASKTINGLVAKKVLTKRQGQHGHMIGINKDYRQWSTIDETSTPIDKTSTGQNVNPAIDETSKNPLTKRQPQKTTPKDNSKRQERASAHMTTADLVNQGIPEQLAKDWLAVRRTKRAPLTNTAWQAMKREAGKAGIPVAEAVRIAAERGWQSFRADWNWQDAAQAAAANPYEVGDLP